MYITYILKATKDVPLIVPLQEQGKVQFGTFISNSAHIDNDYIQNVKLV